MKTLIIGASGQIGKMTTKKMLEQGHDVVALVRDKDKLADIESEQLTITEQDLESDFSSAFDNVEQVIFSAGSGGETGADKTLLIDLWAATKAIDYAVKANVKHFIMVSSIGADDPDNIESEIKPYLVAKHMADQYLQRSIVNYTIVRPGTLLNEPATDGFSTSRPANREDAVINRENVADALAYLATLHPQNLTFELFNGEQPLKQALCQ
ncbi:SDR family oxidoreductase [Pseudoalteromonas sp. J010]|uniref:SDR family oxidoreductase n=1 Tax=Pseudoalteromonas TaxID=53246 RepID=UPI000F654B23|nr:MULTISPECIES: SDR family oxidoreductase [Pseudoalteromonas]MDW7549737.1 SDR family oxidoreductase [Pseudoalteromonas peptidolytica]RRS08858.1 SDR family oxidoreductase [Pseudoalteromonas sp. J010]